ncbi:cysteine desulfurase [Candidatus Azambacteria bacterium]|nr:cysteine desulfurase [Candidatus Azambacteria bacterium]
MKIYYFDYAAATPLDKEVKKAMDSYQSLFWANPFSSHLLGRKAKEAIESAREKIAKILTAKTNEIIFTNSGTEANNLAILGIARKLKTKSEKLKTNGHIIVSKIEHKSILESCRQLEKEGFEVTYLSVDSEGLVNPQEVKKALRPETILVSVMYVNNEIGTIQPIKEIAKIIRDHNKSLPTTNYQLQTSFHSDACQASGFLDLNVQKLGVDLMTFNGSKIYGPKGVGVLFKKRGINLEPLIYGGDQENDLRGGLKNGLAVTGLAKALALAQVTREKESKRLVILRDYLIKRILTEIPETTLNGPSINEYLSIPVIPAKAGIQIPFKDFRTWIPGQARNDRGYGLRRIPNNINISFLGIEAEMLAIYLEKEQIYLSTTSACYSSDSVAGSYVVKEISNQVRAQSAIRITLGKSTRKSDLDFLITKFKIVLKSLRK